VAFPSTIRDSNPSLSCSSSLIFTTGSLTRRAHPVETLFQVTDRREEFSGGDGDAPLCEVSYDKDGRASDS
jgi:hypothetical protein